MTLFLSIAIKILKQFNKLKKVVLFFFFFSMSLLSNGQVLKWSENFEAGFLPSGWNNSTFVAGQWLANTTSACGGSRGARAVYDASRSSWLFTKGYTLQAGYTYYVKYNGKRDKNLQIWVGTSQTSGGMATKIMDQSGETDHSACSTSHQTSNYTASAGTFYFGFYAPFSSYDINIDDIEIWETPPPCSYPTTNATISGVTNVGQNSATLTWSGGDGDKHLVVAKASASVLTQPGDGGSYIANSAFGLGSQLGTGNYVVYDGTGTSVNVTNLDPATTYNFYVYEYKTTGPCYKVAGSTVSQATTACSKYYVNNGATAGDIFSIAIGNNSNTGMGPGKPKLTLRNLWNSYGPSGSNVLKSGDTVFIDAGTYSTSGDAVGEKLMNISVAGITFLGAGNTLTTFDMSASTAPSTDYFMLITANNITLKDFTIKGYENNGTGASQGQAITVQNSATGILIENIVFSQNGASGGNPSLSVLANTSTTVKGGGSLCNVWRTAYTGGIEVDGNGITLNILDYILAYNYKTGSYDGGGLIIHNANLTTTVNVTNTRFFNNEASDGGAISQRGGVLNVTDCIIDGNYAGQTSSNIYGGGVRMTGGNATYARTRFTNNAIGSAGGTLRGAAIGLYSLDGNVNLTLDSCYFFGNLASEGDDLFADKYSGNTINVTARYTTFSNSVRSIYNKDADMISLENCGDPTIQTGSPNSPALIKVNTTNPPFVSTPSTPGIVSGDCNTVIVLPVELINFTTICNTNKTIINWQTASEINNDYFLVQKAGADLDFITIGQVSGNGNSSLVQNYRFEDNEPNNGVAYYRLKQVDFNGEYSYSDLLGSKCDDNIDNHIKIFPNPATNHLNVRLNLTSNEYLAGYVLNVLGEKIMIFSNENIKASEFNLSINELSEGIYYLVIYSSKTGEKIGISKFIKR